MLRALEGTGDVLTTVTPPARGAPSEYYWGTPVFLTRGGGSVKCLSAYTESHLACERVSWRYFPPAVAAASAPAAAAAAPSSASAGAPAGKKQRTA